MQKLDANIYYPFKFSEKQGARRFIPSWSPYAIGLLIIFVAIAFVCVVNPCQNYFRELFSMFIEILSRLLLFRMLQTTKRILPTVIATKNVCLPFSGEI